MMPKIKSKNIKNKNFKILKKLKKIRQKFLKKLHN